MKKVFLSVLFFLTVAGGVSASIGEEREFFADPTYDVSGRNKIPAVLISETSEIYFYIERDWWNHASQNEVKAKLEELGAEFKNNIYPKLTSEFGSEANPGIDKDSKITVLIHPMREGAGGYFRSNDGYPKIQISDSNEREMVYLNSDFVLSDFFKTLLAHEFVHLITFNQKDLKGVEEEIWLNELRAEISSTLLGYDEVFEGSNLEKKVKLFIQDPSDSIIDWQGKKTDYGSIHLFAQYLLDHYGKKVISDSLKSSLKGIDSLNLALKQNGFKESLSQVFVDWAIALLLNDCAYGPKYCYLNKNLKDFKINAQTNFLPLNGESTLTFTDSSKSFAGNWFKVIGGNGNLKFSFRILFGENYRMVYISREKSGKYLINFSELLNNQSELNLENFGTDVTSLFIIPVFVANDPDLYNSFFWSVSIKKNQEDQELIAGLLARIAELEVQIANIQAQLAKAKQQEGNVPQTFSQNLYFGQKSEDVKRLQEFLKSQGPDIYPEGLVTGYYGRMTRAAVIRFQEKYASEILAPLRLASGTGFVGSSTRAKIKMLLTI